MFLKSDKKIQFNALSLVTKLMIFYSASTIGLLSAIGLFLYPTFLKIIEKMNGAGAAYIAAECYKKAIIALLVGSLLSVLFGHVVARKGLNRLREFEEKMENITAASLHERIHLEEWPKELKRFGEKFNTMLDRLQKSFIQLSQFSSDIAHELRTPMHNLSLMTEMELSKAKHTDNDRHIFEKYMDEYRHLSKLIEHLLFLARSDHGQLVLKKERMQAREAILKISDYYQAVMEDNNITVVFNGNAEIWADPDLFKRAISNLLSNALKYTAPGGRIEVNICSGETSVDITIADTGKGIPEEHLHRVFDRFYRVDASRASHAGSLGLGLAIVKSIVELHNGRIAIASELNSGTKVQLCLPL